MLSPCGRYCTVIRFYEFQSFLSPDFTMIFSSRFSHKLMLQMRLSIAEDLFLNTTVPKHIKFSFAVSCFDDDNSFNITSFFILCRSYNWRLFHSDRNVFAFEYWGIFSWRYLFQYSYLPIQFHDGRVCTLFSAHRANCTFNIVIGILFLIVG